MDNRWASPDGYEERPRPVRYRIRDSRGVIVERETSMAYDSKFRRYYHSLAARDQHFADALVDLIQRACCYFYAEDAEYEPMAGDPDIRVSDDEVLARIERLDQGENTREAARTGQAHYPLSELPFDQQRALVEQIEVLKQRWGFEILGEVEEAEAGAQPHRGHAPATR